MQAKKYFFVAFILLLSAAVYGQKLTNSPYGRFNFGVMNPPGSFKSLSMGGISVAMRDNSSISFTNPASYTGVDTTSFVFDMGLDLSRLRLEDGESTFSSYDINFRHILLGFPLSRKIGFAAGLVPFSNGYYYLTRTVTSESDDWDPLTGKYSSFHKGTGSLSTLFAGAAIDITKNFSAGVNFTTLFGRLGRVNQLDFEDFQTTFSQNNSEYLTISGVNLDYGIQYSGKIGKDYFVNAGTSYTGARNYKSSHSRLMLRYSVYSYSPHSPDTLSYSLFSASDSTRLPATFRAGLAFGKKDKFLIGADYTYRLWSDAKVQGASAGMGDTKTISVGLEYIPDKFSNTSYLKRIEYRLGGHMSQNYLVFNNRRIKEYGVSGGVGIRLRNSLSRATIYLDYTVREGNFAEGLHSERIFSAGASLNFYDFWFMKRRYE